MREEGGGARLARWVRERGEGRGSVGGVGVGGGENSFVAVFFPPFGRLRDGRRERPSGAPPCSLWGWGERVLHRASSRGWGGGGGSRLITIRPRWAGVWQGEEAAGRMSLGRSLERGVAPVLPSLSPPPSVFPEQRNVD